VPEPSALEAQVEALPREPGVYLFRSARGKVAQSLRTRVRSYFRPGGDGRPQVPLLVERTADVEVVVTPNVKDALLLENELIKRHKPTFNVRLRDDKQYLGLRMDPREDWPRLTHVRRFREDGAWHFGPYTSSSALRDAVSNLRRVFPLRSCSDAVFRDYARRGRPCIEHEMKRCLAPCCGKVEAGVYRELVEGTRLFLRGRSDELMRDLEDRMRAAAEAEDFEGAARMRDRLAAVHQTVERQQIVAEKAVDRDVFGFARSGADLEIHALHVRAGRVVDHASFAFSDVQLDDEEAMGSFLGQYYGAPDRTPTREILVAREPVEPDALAELFAERAGRRVILRRPQRGSARSLVEMADRNALLRLEQRLAARDSVAAALEALREDLGLTAIPRHIECYDVSNLQGTLAVASRVSFRDGVPERSAYRRYRIREAAAGDDYACMREVLTRRLARSESDPLPDLMMVDGGKGQLGVMRACVRDAGLEVDLVGIAKERDDASASLRVRRGGGLKAERLFVPGRKDAIQLEASAPSLLLLQRVRDEAHRFAIEFQRHLRQRANMVSILEEIPGIGPKKRRQLLRELGSLRAVRQAGAATLGTVNGISVRDAEAIATFFERLDRKPETPEQAVVEDGKPGLPSR
jgi:excinuclease ABC subunit C